jgi:phosphoribosylamine--glycine ligase
MVIFTTKGKSMKVLVIGSGGREHAIAWKLAESKKVSHVYIAPGNGGTATETKCSNVPFIDNLEGWKDLIAFAKKEQIDFTVVGPEVPLASGIADFFRSEGLAIVGADKKSAELESSKVFSKDFMQKYKVRTAASENFSDYDKAITYAKNYFASGKKILVIKADGLAAGKGVVIAASSNEAEEALVSFMKDSSLGEAGNTVVLEEFLQGKEVSVLAAVDVKNGKGNIVPFISARDHKRRFDGGQGPNTGGMGAIAPVPDYSEKAQADFITSILQPTLNGIKNEGMDYRGFIFFGLMVHNDKCSLLEYNVRLGDPETQAVLPLMDFDFAELCLAIIESRLESFAFSWKQGAVCAPVAVAEGYPANYRKGDVIHIDDNALQSSGAKLFAAGAVLNENAELVTNGGRVLAVSVYGTDADDAWNKAYQAMNAVRFEGMGYRKDIGKEQ